LVARGGVIVPLFEVARSELVPFRRLKGAADLYEKEIEDLLWANLDEFTGETLFPVARQAKIPSGGKPCLLALDRFGRVVVFEVKRDVDREQLAQCLECANWAKKTNLEELAGMYQGGEAEFWPAWTEFTETDAPVLVSAVPKLYLVARDFEDRTENAFEFSTDIEFLAYTGVPVWLVRVVVYEDVGGRRFIDVEGDHEPLANAAVSGAREPDHAKFEGRRVRVQDLLEHDLLAPQDQLVWIRPRNGKRYEATVTSDGLIRLADGREVTTPSKAAVEAAGVAAYDGWYAWTVTRLGKTLNDLRHDLHTAARQTDAG
jgi:hypothetical protein